MEESYLKEDTWIELLKEFNQERVWSRGSQGNLRVMSYNVLADSCLKMHLNMYPYPEEILNLSRRSWLVCQEIKEFNPDILGMQEVDAEFTGYQDTLRDYQCHYKKKTGGKLDGCLIAWKAHKFILIEKIEVEFLAKDPELARFLDRDNIGLVCVLALVEDPSKIVIFGTTHILFNEKRGDLKLTQLILMTKTLKKAKKKYGGSVILSGDFNVTPSSAIYKLISTGSLDLARASQYFLGGKMTSLPIDLYEAVRIAKRAFYEAPEPKYLKQNSQLIFYMHNLGLDISEGKAKPTFKNRRPSDQLSSLVNFPLALKSSYKSILGKETFPTQFLPRQRTTVDYIWFEGQILPKRVLMCPSFASLNQFQTIPNEVIPSDHFPLLAEFEI